MRAVRLTVRLRIALSFGALFFVGGLLILAVVFALVRNDLLNPTTATTVTTVPVDGDTADHEALEREVRAVVREEALRSLLVRSGGALVLLTFGSAAAGWAVAGVVLRPVHRITDAAKRASSTQLDHRVHLEGPDDELKDLADTFDGMLDRLEAGIGAQRRFAANAAHELRTPLTVIRTATEIGLADPASASADQVAEAAADIRTATIEAEQLISKLLELARSEHGVQDPATIDLAGVVGEVASSFGSAVAAGGLRLDVELQPATVPGDRALVDLAVSNLLANAVRYNRPGGEVEVRCGTEDHAGFVEVSNDGDVIDDEQVARLCEPFVRGGGTRRAPARGEGTGLGLSIVQAVARAHGGELHLTARPGGGLTARLHLPDRR